MARGNEQAAKVEQVVAPDFDLMRRTFLNDLKPLDERGAKVRGDQSQAWKIIEKDAHCNKAGAKVVFKLLNMSEETRDDFLRTLYGGMKACNIGISQDLVDKMSGSDAPTMPTVPNAGMGADSLATIAGNDQVETAPAA